MSAIGGSDSDTSCTRHPLRHALTSGLRPQHLNLAILLPYVALCTFLTAMKIHDHSESWSFPFNICRQQFSRDSSRSPRKRRLSSCFSHHSIASFLLLLLIQAFLQRIFRREVIWLQFHQESPGADKKRTRCQSIGWRKVNSLP